VWGSVCVSYPPRLVPFLAMASPQPLLATDDDSQGFIPKCKDKMKGGAKQGGKVCIGGCLAVFLVLCIVQAVMYAAVTTGCGPKAIGADYSFPGGGKSANGSAAFNLIPQLSLLAERKVAFWGWAFDLLPANDAGSTAGAQTGTFWRNNGPLFYTYTYEDIANSKLTVYMRKRFWMPYMSYMIARCDGKGPIYTFSEGHNWISNKIRKFFSMNQAQTYLLYADNELVANVQEVGGNGYPSLTLNDVENGKEEGSAILKERNFHGNSDQWYISNHFLDEAPYFLTAMIALPTAYGEAEAKIAKSMQNEKPPTPQDGKTPETFLFESTSNAPSARAHQPTKMETKGDIKLQHV